MNKNNLLIQKYFEEHSFIESNIRSFDNFVDKGMQEAIKEIEDVVPTIIPQEMQDFKIKFDKVWVQKPLLIEADGSKRDIFPIEGRLRNLTYSGPIHLQISTHIDGVQRESFNTQIGKLPIMLKSKYCHLSGLKEQELIEKGEDPNDPGGYFVLNGNERVLITVEDLASNKLFVEKASGPAKFLGRVFSEKGSYRVPHILEQMKDGIIYLSFTRFKRIPIISIIKALGIVKDSEISKWISEDRQYDDIYINLFDSINLKSQAEAVDFISKKIGIAQQDE
ncbi:MAG TPA: DNA-directed RNA polymerase subunit B'', partial [Candidatus Nanoarchaeia archaeon]|nr:DNA-directed RNA polymerase subunit B'' [Candidatus Nanoarchaeia archaeon]